MEIYGPESSGKTTIALQAIAQCQKAGGVAAFIDAEHALDITYARALGVKTDELLISQPDSGEQALEIAETLVRSGAVDMVVIDSVAALVPRAELEGDMGDVSPGAQARLMARRCARSPPSRSNCCMVFINHSDEIGVLAPRGHLGWQRACPTHLADIRRIGSIKNGSKWGATARASRSSRTSLRPAPLPSSTFGTERACR